MTPSKLILVIKLTAIVLLLSLAGCQSTSSDKPVYAGPVLPDNYDFRFGDKDMAAAMHAVYLHKTDDLEQLLQAKKFYWYINFGHLESAPLLSHLAIIASCYDCIDVFVKVGFDLNKRDKYGRTPLIYAALSSKPKFIPLLAPHSDIDARLDAKTGFTALHMATNKNFPATIKALVEQGADIEARDVNQWTALHHAVQMGFVESSKMLLELGADPNALSVSNWTTLHQTGNRINTAEEANIAAIAKLLLDAGVNIDVQSDKGITALQLSIWQRRDSVTELLLAQNSDIHVVDHEGWSALSYAVDKGDIKTAKALLEAGVDPQPRSSTGWTPLMFLANDNYQHDELIIEFAELLIEYGASVFNINNGGKSIADLAKENNKPALLKLLQYHGAKATD